MHHAVLTYQKELLERLILLDADHCKLRAAKDCKDKTPQQLDQ